MLVVFQYTLATFVISALKLLTIGVIVGVRHKFKVLGSIVILDFILMIYNESIFVTINKMNGNESMDLRLYVFPGICKRHSLIPSSSIFRLYYPAFIMPGMNSSSVCGHDVAVKAAHTSYVTDLIKTFIAFNVFPNFFLHDGICFTLGR